MKSHLWSSMTHGISSMIVHTQGISSIIVHTHGISSMIIHDSWITCHAHGLILSMVSHELWMDHGWLFMDGQPRACIMIDSNHYWFNSLKPNISILTPHKLERRLAGTTKTGEITFESDPIKFDYQFLAVHIEDSSKLFVFKQRNSLSVVDKSIKLW